MNSTHRTLISVKSIGLDYSLGLSLRNRKKYTVLKDISFELYAGDSLGVIGRNGAGKSTLLKLLANIITPDRGEIINHNAKVALMALQVGFDYQSSGRENILLSGLLLGFDENQILDKLESIVNFSELGQFIDQAVRTYSTGMKARLGFSICYILQPEVMLIDEVLGVGDFDFRKKSNAAMKERIQSDQTVVLVSHDAKTIKALCNRAIWIENGTCQMVGDAAEVVDAYEEYITKVPKTD